MSVPAFPAILLPISNRDFRLPFFFMFVDFSQSLLPLLLAYLGFLNTALRFWRILLRMKREEGAPLLFGLPRSLYNRMTFNVADYF